jgi:hypothetical protein
MATNLIYLYFKWRIWQHPVQANKAHVDGNSNSNINSQLKGSIWDPRPQHQVHSALRSITKDT